MGKGGLSKSKMGLKYMWLAMSRTVLTSIWDADRCIAVDENGMEVHGDYILYVCGKYLKELGRLLNNTVVVMLMSNMELVKIMKRESGTEPVIRIVVCENSEMLMLVLRKIEARRMIYDRS